MKISLFTTIVFTVIICSHIAFSYIDINTYNENGYLLQERDTLFIKDSTIVIRVNTKIYIIGKRGIPLSLPPVLNLGKGSTPASKDSKILTIIKHLKL